MITCPVCGVDPGPSGVRDDPVLCGCGRLMMGTDLVTFAIGTLPGDDRMLYVAYDGLRLVRDRDFAYGDPDSIAPVPETARPGFVDEVLKDFFIRVVMDA